MSPHSESRHISLMWLSMKYFPLTQMDDTSTPNGNILSDDADHLHNPATEDAVNIFVW